MAIYRTTPRLAVSRYIIIFVYSKSVKVKVIVNFFTLIDLSSTLLLLSPINLIKPRRTKISWVTLWNLVALIKIVGARIVREQFEFRAQLHSCQ